MKKPANFRNRRNQGSVLSWILAIIGIAFLAIIATPNLVKARTTTCTGSCLSNFKQMEGAKLQWAVENRKNPEDAPDPSEIFGPTLYIKQWPKCPLGGTYSLNTVGRNATCTVQGHSLRN